jgi:hypothetical protein
MRRIIVAMIFAAAGLSLCCHSYIFFEEKQYIALTTYLDNPARYEGKEGLLYGRIVSLTDDGFMLNSNSAEIRVIYDKPVGMTLLGSAALFGTYTDNTFRAQRVQVVNFLQFKFLLSIIGLAIVLHYFVKEWKMTSRGIGERNA